VVNSFNITKAKKKNHYKVTINGLTAIWQHYELDNLIQTIDNNIGLKPQKQSNYEKSNIKSSN